MNDAFDTGIQDNFERFLNECVYEAREGLKRPTLIFPGNQENPAAIGQIALRVIELAVDEMRSDIRAGTDPSYEGFCDKFDNSLREVQGSEFAKEQALDRVRSIANNVYIRLKRDLVSSEISRHSRSLSFRGPALDV